ncbi:MAG: helix-turn-helix domain-containing protein [Candidatus Contendobacter sp.]|nr:helix-turn-helix domain-containing protein [Candidatus Contendobacter sp.]MDS4060413.1 helix-turn-helix domain-containing protein [Candidatus Contendobacter sp.]
MNEPYLTIQEVAARWKISVPTVRRMIAHGEVASVHIGRAVRIERSEIERFESSRRRADRDLIRAQESSLAQVWNNADDEVWNDA